MMNEAPIVCFQSNSLNFSLGEIHESKDPRLFSGKNIVGKLETILAAHLRIFGTYSLYLRICICVFPNSTLVPVVDLETIVAALL